MTMIERIERELDQYLSPMFADANDRAIRRQNAARAVLRAMREPTPEMVATTLPHVDYVWDGEMRRIVDTALLLVDPTVENDCMRFAQGMIVAKDLVRDWRTMIDAALAEKPHA